MMLLMLTAMTGGGFETGNTLYQKCQGNITQLSLCIGYIGGAYDGIAAMQDQTGQRIICPPAGVTQGQMRDIVVKYLQYHPETRNELAADLTALALGAAFPCPRK